MGKTGVLEARAQADLAVLVGEISRDYRTGVLERLAAADPAWRADLDRAEREVGALWEALRDADETLGRWQEALADLRRVWSRVREGEEAERAALRDVA